MIPCWIITTMGIAVGLWWGYMIRGAQENRKPKTLHLSIDKLVAQQRLKRIQHAKWLRRWANR